MCVCVCFAQWEDKVEKGQKDFEKLSKVIRREVSRFEAYRVDDFKNSVVQYLQTLMENQQKVGAGSLLFCELPCNVCVRVVPEIFYTKIVLYRPWVKDERRDTAPHNWLSGPLPWQILLYLTVKFVADCVRALI